MKKVEEVVKEIKVELQKFMENFEGDEDNLDEWLRTLYDSFLNRMLSDNERIWKTGVLFIPLSLSAFGALIAIDNIIWWKVAVLGFASSTIIRVWNIIAENHRTFQQNSEAWLIAIQETIGLKYHIHKTVDQKRNKRIINPLKMRKTHDLLSMIVPIMWAFILILTIIGVIK
ncbi:MAG: hypothetical protein R3250_06310 [Melioribacteraceae bacterium]|nr:hypothetical protein [Melioribacteraceae bacterium]